MVKYNKYHNKPNKLSIQKTKNTKKLETINKQYLNSFYSNFGNSLNTKIKPHLNSKSLLNFLNTNGISKKQIEQIKGKDLQIINKAIVGGADNYQPVQLKGLGTIYNFFIILAIFLFMSCGEGNNENNDIPYPSYEIFNNNETISKPDNSDKVKYDFEKMKNFNNVLVICANQDEFNGYKKIMGEKISEETKSGVKKGKEIKNEEGHIKYSYLSKNYNLIHKDFVEKHLGKNEKYKLIQIKGHGSDMLDLLEIVKNHKHQDGCMLVMGGCVSENFRRDAQEYGFVTFANIYKGESSHNDYLTKFIAENISNLQNIKQFVELLKEKAQETYTKYTYPDTTLKKF